MEMRQMKRGGKDVVEFENSQIKVVLVPEIARFPLSYVYKPTGHDFLVQPESLDTPNATNRHVYYGGIVDAVPWVSGKVNGQRLADKGYLPISPWTVASGTTNRSSWLEGRTRFTYPDPVTAKPTTLQVTKKITVFDDSTQLQMEYVVSNESATDARMVFAVHSRAAINTWDEGDYFFAPGNRCFVYDMNNMPDVEARGIKKRSWTAWPLVEATELHPVKESKSIFVFVPADWCALGDEKTKETLFFVAGPVRIAGKPETMKMGIFRTSQAFVTEPCLSYSLEANPERWENADETVKLKPGETAEFTVTLAAYQGVTRREVTALAAAYPGCLLITPPRVKREGDTATMTGALASAGAGNLRWLADGKTLVEKKIAAGLFDLKGMGAVPCQGTPAFSLVLETASGTRTIPIQP